MNTTSRRPSAALIVSMVALVAALAGSAVALPGKNSVDKNDIKKNAVKSKAIKNSQVKAADIADGSVGAAELADAEAAHIVGAAGEPAFESGGDGDCTWIAVNSQNVPGAAAFASPGFYKDTDGRVHLSGTAIAQAASGGDTTCGQDGAISDDDRDGVVFILPEAYRPAQLETFFPNGGGSFGAAVNGPTALEGTDYASVPPGAVIVNLDDMGAGNGDIGALSGISFRAASGAARAAAPRAVELPGGSSLFP